jgi:hypothetical protein
MPTPNVNLILQAVLAATNNLLSPAPQIATFNLGNPTLGATQFFYEPYFQALVGGSAVSLPATKIFAIIVQNLSPTAVLSVTHTPFGAAASTSTLGPNGVCIFFDPLETGGGFSALTLTGVGGTVPAAVLVAV